MSERHHEGEFERFSHAGRTVVLCRDPDAESPRDNDGNLCVIACWHRQYELGDRQLRPGNGVDYSDRQEMVASLEAGGDQVLCILPVWIYDHSGIFLRAAAERPGYPFDCRWDAGQVGWAYVFKSTAVKVGCEPGKSWERDGQTVTYDQAEYERQIAAEVDLYDRWGRGEFSGYLVEDEDGDVLESCWGFDDEEYCREQAREAAEGARSPGQVDGGCDARCEP